MVQEELTGSALLIKILTAIVPRANLGLTGEMYPAQAIVLQEDAFSGTGFNW